MHSLADNAGVDVPQAKPVRLNNEFHTFCVERFDRANGARRFYASAMTLLRKEHSEGTSYLELAKFLRANGDGACVAEDLEQLFRRAAFNVAVGNRDDHLRNHGKPALRAAMWNSRQWHSRRTQSTGRPPPGRGTPLLLKLPTAAASPTLRPLPPATPRYLPHSCAGICAAAPGSRPPAGCRAPG